VRILFYLLQWVLAIAAYLVAIRLSVVWGFVVVSLPAAIFLTVQIVSLVRQDRTIQRAMVDEEAKLLSKVQSAEAEA
jgi:hypothetical protein